MRDVAAPELIRNLTTPDRADGSAGLGAGGVASPYRARSAPAPELEPVLFRFAWAGRTSTYDQQDPTLSLPRQLRSCGQVLPEDAVVVAHFYDVESGRKDLDTRGRSTAHEMFSIPIARDGGIHDLLAEAERPDRRFDYVICESIERIARRTYIGTDIENRLERAGVRLLAADEPFNLAPTGGRKAKVATQLLTRRVKQGIAEFYVIEMLEKSWDGFAVHTEQGFNIGKPCYGHRARQVAHPVPAKRAKGQKKTFLEPDPAQAPVVRRIFAWRLGERAGYQVIADRLNDDLAANPPPTPVDPERAVGRWTASNVRDVLTNPKHTGHMVWNRHARKSGSNRANPVSEWIWSPQPVHEALVDLESFIAAQEISGHRFGSRSSAGPNTAHPDTKRSYLLRTYLFCELCGRRMFGKTRRSHAYYVCAPRKDYTPDGHPTGGAFFVREDQLVDGLNDFLSQHVFGAYRRALLDTTAAAMDADARRDHEERVAALRRAIGDTDQRIKRTIRSLELVDDPDPDLLRDINERRAELRAHRQDLETQLDAAEARIHAAPNPDLIDALPVTRVEVDQLPEHLARDLFEALRLEIHYNKLANQARCRITLSGTTVAAARKAADRTVSATHPAPADPDPPGEPDNADSVPILVVPPAGFEPATPALGERCSIP
ncbi:DNA invertase Pin-like site-specific DNA recombinase [Pseudonocardia kunmingensis]|uniref:DNA invertase Pin-like site-specific DNA recombinase n=1 Tax=Pseudonocardia kunmingensis TaxID=630975 RepID=A0A543D9I5_9PSEU|nr:DNA invertase Pin-like site-specific DNA recombinase [Pseudonocardia kunmingensis]